MDEFTNFNRKRLPGIETLLPLAKRHTSTLPSIQCVTIQDIEDEMKLTKRQFCINSLRGRVWYMVDFVNFQDRNELFHELIKPDTQVKFELSKKKGYAYSKFEFQADIWPESMARICKRVNHLCGTTFNSCVVHMYRDGKDHMVWHSDVPEVLGEGGKVATVSLGGSRRMIFKAVSSSCRMSSTVSRDLPLIQQIVGDGSLIVMEGQTQRYYLHCIPKTTKIVGTTISMTFRKIKNP